MAWRETERSKAVMIRRTYKCDVCLHEWQETYLDGADIAIPECEECEVPAERLFKPFGVKTNKSRAMDFTQKMAEEQFGLTNFADNQRAGDTAYIAPPPIQTAEREAISREMVAAGFAPLNAEQANLADSFWNNGQGQPKTGDPAIDQAVEMAVAGKAAAATASREMGADPISLLNKAGRPGMKLDVVSAVKAK